jgi:hypothetical protein
MRVARSVRPKQATSKRITPAAVAATGAIVVAIGALAGCGAVSSGRLAGLRSASQKPATSGGGAMIHMLCTDRRAVTSVRVMRFPLRSQLGQTKPLPRPLPGITIKYPARARTLATLICQLPRMPHGVFHCPLDGGGGYVLVFSAASARFHAVTLRASGCETVTGTGSGRARWVARTPQFWDQLAHLTGIASPAHT